MAAKGRHWVGFWLVFALAVLAAVVARQTSALATARDLSDTRTAHSTLEAERAALIQRIRSGASRAELIPRAKALGLRLPADSEILILRVTDTVRH
ncbi:MAG TPA: hypothetical protein VGI83_01265 [Gemmatimonadales bacterium]|jgi:hypothetical protein